MHKKIGLWLQRLPCQLKEIFVLWCGDNSLGGEELGDGFGHTQQGYTIFLSEPRPSTLDYYRRPALVNLITWKSQKAQQQTVATFSGETQATVTAFDAAQWLNWAIIETLGTPPTPKSILLLRSIGFTDCGSLVDWLSGTR